MWTGVLLLSLLPAGSSAGSASQTAPQTSLAAECATWQECQAQVESALAAESFERAHDVAWRAVQRGPKDDPALMFLLARAQSMAGRPQDALVMVRRLAERGVPTEALTHPDLARARSLEGWAEVEVLVARANMGEPPAPPVTAPARSRPTKAAPAGAARSTPGPKGAAPVPAVRGAARGTAADAASLPESSLRFASDRFIPAGLAYDAVSRRFVMGDQLGRKLRVVGEGLDHTVDLVRSESAGFLDVRALAIDARRGDLWVATSDAGGDTATLHRLQLISGRPLQSLSFSEAPRPVRPVDLAITEAGLVFVLDGEGRIFRTRAAPAALELVMALEVERALSLTFGTRGETVAYVSHAGGLLRVDLDDRTSAEVGGPAGLPLTGMERLRAHRDGYVALQSGPDGDRRLVRFELSRNGRTVRGVTRYDVRVEAARGPTAVAVSGDELSLVTVGLDTGDAVPPASAIGPPAELVVRRFRLR